MNDRPNILLITTDQQRFDTIQALGNPYIFTPHLNWLADGGIAFTNAYSDCPLCVPARATIMTGRHGYSMGLTGNRGDIRPINPEYSLPGLLTQAGYQTRAEGKMHFIPNRCHYGFEHMEILEDYYRYMAEHPEYGVPMDHGVGQNELAPVISTVHESRSLTQWTVNRSINFLETRDEERPFFLWTSFAKPHPPLDPCLNYWKLYENAPVPDPIAGDWSGRVEEIPRGFLTPSYILNMAHRYSPVQLQAIRRAYYACITQIDYALGLLFARMRELGLLNRTLILFTSDHGEMLGDHGMGAKTVGFEGSAHIPMIIRPPQPDWGPYDERRGRICRELVCLADVLPTCLNYAGVAIPEAAGVEGIDLLAVEAGRVNRERLIGEGEEKYFYIREGRFKYLLETLSGGELLFDLEQDPGEKYDLIRAGTHAETVKKMRQLMSVHLCQRQNPVVQDGQIELPLERKEWIPAQNTWPGFHSRLLPDEVAH